MFSGWCWIGDGEPGTKLGKASATTHFGPHRGGGLMMTADLSTRRRHHPSLSLEFGVVGGRLSSIQLQVFGVSPDPLYLSRPLSPASSLSVHISATPRHGISLYSTCGIGRGRNLDYTHIRE
jgi:hypothetical protein